MLKLAFLAVLVAVCSAQPPPPEPVLHIPETFMARYEVKITPRGFSEEKGEGSWERSASLEDYKRIERLSNSSGDIINIEHLGLFKDHEEYHIENGECTKRPIPDTETFPTIWKDFAEKGKFMGERTVPVGNTTTKVYVWEINYGEGELAELWTRIPSPGMEITKPFGMARRGSRGVQTDIFSSFIATDPPATSFQVPSECPIAKRRVAKHRVL